MDDALLYGSAVALARAIRGKQVSVTEVVEAHLQRIEAVNPALNAVVQLAAERALDEARAADRALVTGDNLGPLHGVPMTSKIRSTLPGLLLPAVPRAGQRLYRQKTPRLSPACALPGPFCWAKPTPRN